MAHWVMQSGDNAGLPYALVDKKAAMLYLFGADGRLRAASPALLGAAPGDRGAPDLNQRDLSTLAMHERTTPAGRYVAQPGRNLQGEPVVWVDYGAALAIHRLRPGPSAERRAERLRSATPEDNKVSLGCVVVPVDFYTHQVEPLLGHGRSVVYILPETVAASAVFGWQ
nr:L,D-transpeptidase [Variovorax boronicumulans]